MANQTHYASASLYVGDLHPEVTEAKLYEVFNSVGPVASIRVCRDSVTKKSLGYAYVNYHSLQDAERALDTLNYTQIRGSQCRIMWSHRDPALRKSGAGNIFVKNLDKEIDNKALYDTFSLFGNILSCKVATDDLSKSRGFGFVHYEAEESAKTAIEKVNGMQIGSKTVYVGPFVRKLDRPGSRDSHFTNIYVKHIPADWTEDQLRDTFEKFGVVTSAALRVDSRRGKPFGFINFRDSDSAKAAVDAMNGKTVGGEVVCEDGDTVKEDADTKGGMEGKSGDATTKGETPEDVTDLNPGGNDGGKDNESQTIERLYVARAQSKRERTALLKSRFEVNPERRQLYQGKNVYIKNLDDTIDDAKLREAFEPFGTITSIKVMRDERGVSRGFGFVCFLTADEATKAINEMHLKVLYNKPLYVGLAEKKDQRTARLHNRFRGIANMRQGPMATSVPTQLQFHAPPQMYYNSMQPHVSRPMMGYNQQNVMPWRAPIHRPSFQNVGGIPAQMSSIMYPQMGPGTMGGTPVPLSGGAMRAPRMPYRGNAGMHIHSKTQMSPMSPNKQQYKFTPQARNRTDFGMGPMEAVHGLGLGADTNLTPALLNATTPEMQKQILGEQLYPRVAKLQPDLAGKITGMMLEMENSELLSLLNNEGNFKGKVDEALRVLKNAQHVHDQS